MTTTINNTASAINSWLLINLININFCIDLEMQRREPQLHGSLTLLVPLVTSILQRQADRTVMPCTVLPVGDDLSGWCTVSHWECIKGKEIQMNLCLFFSSFILNKKKKKLWKHITYLGRTCQPGSGSCGWGRFSWCGNGAERRPSPPRWHAPAAGTYVHGATGPAAAESVYASQGRLSDLVTHHQPQA